MNKCIENETFMGKCADLVKAIQDDYQIFNQSIDIIEQIKKGNTQGWKKFLDRETKVYYRKEDGKSLYTFYLEKIVNAPIFNLMAVIAEAQTFKEWIPLLYKSDITCEVSHFRKSGEFAVTVPWPFYNRSVYIKVSAMPVKTDDAIIINMKTIEGDKWLGKDIKKDEKQAEAIVHYCSAYIETIGENK